MRLPDFILNSAAFLVSVASAESSEAEYDLEGTGFFVGLPSTVCAPESFFYFVTAGHTVKQIRSQTAIRVNLKGGGASIVPVPTEAWRFHPSDPSADVAIAPFPMTQLFDVLSISESHFATKEVMRGLDIGVGDEVHFPGLFTYASGEKRNVPIVRHGTIAMLPDEPVQTESGFMDAILIEARSIAGLSGSPVFARSTISLTWDKDGQTKSLQGLTGELRLLGMAHGHWDIRESEINQPGFTHDRVHGVNVGIAIVIPAQKILETLNQPQLIQERRLYEEFVLSQRSAGSNP